MAADMPITTNFSFGGGGGGSGFNFGGNNQGLSLQNVLRRGGTVGPGQSVGVSQDQFAYPKVAENVAGTAAGLGQQSSAELLNLLRDPTSNPGYQASLKGVLESMRPGIEQGYQDLSDAFRNAGAMQDGSYGNALAKYAGEVNRNQTIAASDVLSKLFPTLVSGYSGPANNAPNLLQALKQRSSVDLQNQGGQQPGGLQANSGANKAAYDYSMFKARVPHA